MKRAALLIFLSALGVFNFYCAFSPHTQRYMPLPIKSERLRRLVYKLFGTVLLLAVFFLLYGAFMPTISEE